MIAVNLGALCLIGWFGGVYAQAMKRHALWGLVFSLYPGFILSLARDLTEILEIAMLMGGLLLIRKGRQVFAIIFLTLAVFAKETALLVPVVLFLSYPGPEPYCSRILFRRIPVCYLFHPVCGILF